MNHEERFKKETMRRVYAVFFMRKLYGRIARKVYLIAALLYLESYAVSFKHVVANMPSLTDFGATARFYSYAFLHTEVLVQLTLVALTALALWIFRDLLRKESSLPA